MTTKACEGAITTACRMGTEHAKKCQACGTKVRDDMVEHAFFGFAASCDHTSKKLITAEQNSVLAGMNRKTSGSIGQP